MISCTRLVTCTFLRRSSAVSHLGGPAVRLIRGIAHFKFIGHMSIT